MAPPSLARFWLFLRGSVLALLAVLSLPLAAAQEPFRLLDGGKVRDFRLDEAEVQITRAGAASEALKTQIEAGVPGAVVQASSQGRALAKVPRLAGKTNAQRAAEVSRALPGAGIEAVLYPAAGPQNDLTRRIATAQVLVKVPAGGSAAALAASVAASESTPTSIVDRAMLRFPSGFHALDAAKVLQARGVDAQVQLRQQRIPQFVPNDLFFPNQWHLRNSGQSGGTVGIDANVVPAWDITTGAGPTIAVVDDGLETTHPDLDPNCPPLARGFHHDFNGDDNDPAPEGSGFFGDKHGTSVGGVAAAKGNNTLGVSGSAPDAELVGFV